MTLRLVSDEGVERADLDAVEKSGAMLVNLVHGYLDTGIALRCTSLACLNKLLTLLLFYFGLIM
jgi:hypothetical protein